MHSTTTTTTRPATQGTTTPPRYYHNTWSVREEMENSDRVMHCGGGDLWMDCETGEMLSFEQARAVYRGDFRQRHADGDRTSIAAGEQ